MKDLKSYVKSVNSKQKDGVYHIGEDSCAVGTDKQCNVSQQDRQNIEEAVNKYGSMSEEQLMNELGKEVSKGTQNGTITRESMQQFYDTVSPMLNQEQLAKLRNIIRNLNI